MKLEPKQVIPYLPYSLKVIMEGKKCNVAWMSTKNISIIRPDGIGEMKKINWEHAHLNIKPILRPITDLYNCVDGDVRNITYFSDIGIYSEGARIAIIERPYFLDYRIFIKLLEWHFDVFGLIEKGLAIDINTINPK